MLTLPNILTLSRIVTVPLLAAFLWWPESASSAEREPSRASTSER